MVLALIRAAGGCRRLPEAVKAGAHARLEPVVSGVPGGCRRGRRIPPGACRTRAGSYDDAERRALSREAVLQAVSLEMPPLFLKRRNRIWKRTRSLIRCGVPFAARRGPCRTGAGVVRFRIRLGTCLRQKPRIRKRFDAGPQEPTFPAVAYIPLPSMTKGVRPWCIQHAGRGMYGAAVALGFHPWRWPRSGAGATGCGSMAPCGFAAERAAWSWPFRLSPLAGASVRLLPSSAGRVSYPIQLQ